MQAIVGHTSRGLHELCATDVKKKKKKKKRPPETRHLNQYRVFITLVHFTGVRVGERKKRWDDDNANRTF